MARGKKGGKSDSNGQITIKFTGECWVCGRAGHKQSECWYNPNPKAKAKAAAKWTKVDKSVKCEQARPTPSSSTSAADGELTTKKRKSWPSSSWRSSVHWNQSLKPSS